MSVVYGSQHIKTPIGILKVIEILCMLLGVILVTVDQHWRADYMDAFLAGTVIGLVISVLLLLISLTSAATSMEGLIRFQYICHILLFIYLLIVSAILVDRSRDWAKQLCAGGAFGLIGAAAYLIDALFCYRAYGNSVACF